jgi:hypothetical protein
MKSAEPKQKQASKNGAKASRDAEPARRIDKDPRRAPAEAPRAKDTEPGSPMPDLATFGVSQGDARAHVGACEDCGRAHRHVVKNPKDAMALESFGRRIASCLASKQPAARA